MRFNNIVTSPCKERNWAYINFLQVGKHIVMPSFNIQISIIASVLRPNVPNTPVLSVDQPKN